MSDESLERSLKIEQLASEVGHVAFGIALRMLGDRESAQDALQDAYFQAYQGLTKFRGEASLKTWFLRILVNCCRRHRRVWRRLTSTVTGEDLLSDAQIQDEIEGDPVLRETINRAVLRLPHRQRTAFVLRFGQELTIGEIADVMGCAKGTVKASLHKAVEKLRRELGRELVGGDP